jgi:DNA repair protein RadC
MPERIYQSRFDHLFQLEYSSQDVTPEGFIGIKFPGREPESRPPLVRLDPEDRLSRFVREVQEPLQIISPAAAARYFLDTVFNPFNNCSQEELWGMPLDTKNYFRFVSMIYRGNVNSSIIRPAEVYRDAIIANSTAIILAHNHPSGQPTPSPEDVQVTRILHQAGDLLGIELLDHLVIGRDKWVSLKERGLGFD